MQPDTGLIVEGHWALFPTEYAVYAALNVQLPDLMQRAQDWETGGVTLRVPDACDHLIFLLLHAFKHFISSGVGVRQLCDIALWMRRFGAQIDWQRVRAALRATHSEGFAAAVIDAGVHWFGLECAAAHIPPDWETLESAALLADALSGGVYGSADSTRRHSCTIHHSRGGPGVSRRHGARIALCGALSRARGDGGLVSVCRPLSGTAARRRGRSASGATCARAASTPVRRTVCVSAHSAWSCCANTRVL